jgi:cell division protein FtsB
MCNSKQRAACIAGLYMITRQKKRNNRGRLIAPVMAALIFGYFGTQAYKGDYGIRSNIRLQNKAVELEKELIKVSKKRIILEKRVALLRNGTIEKDMLDEQVRRSLGMVDMDDVVLLR